MCMYNIGSANTMDGTRLNSLEEYNVFFFFVLLLSFCVMAVCVYVRYVLLSSFLHHIIILFANEMATEAIRCGGVCVYVCVFILINKHFAYFHGLGLHGIPV